MPEGDHVVDDSKLKLPTGVEFAGAVASGEENEVEVFKHRAKMMRVDDGKLKNRGLGNVRVLRHKETGALRLILRQEKTLKLVVNHYIPPEAAVTTHPGDDRVLLYKADDFSENELTPTAFAIKFSDAELTKDFEAKFKEWQEAMKKLAASGGASAAAPGGGGAAAAGAGGAPAPAADPVPIRADLEPIYGDTHTMQAERYAALGAAFEAEYGSPPAFFVRAPGRVNIIGEHIDYHGYSVLPCALDNDIVIAVDTVDFLAPTVAVGNMNSAFSAGTFPTDPSLPVDRTTGLKWFQYVQCGYKGAFDSAPASKSTPKRGLRLFIDGRVPPAAGVSSSSALVVASALATAHAFGIKLSRTQLADAARLSEQYIGTIGGGMDQAISCLAEVGKAQHIEFNPLRAHSVNIPPGGVLVIANSLVKAAKAEDPTAGYNFRVVEGKLAAKLVAKRAGVPTWATIKTFLELQQALGVERVGDLITPVETHLRDGLYTNTDLVAADALGQDPMTLFEGDPKKEGVLKVLAAGHDRYMLLNRARHIVTEAARVWAFRSVCESEPSASQLPDLGALMSESHESCRDDYDCSADDLDTLVDLCMASGAYGARLTGAGWGGCAVALVPASRLEGFIKALADGYFATRTYTGDISDVLFASKPAGGAAVHDRRA